MQEIIGGMQAAIDNHALKLVVLANIMAAVAKDTNAVRPLTHPRRVVCKVENPKGLMISEY